MIELVWLLLAVCAVGFALLPRVKLCPPAQKPVPSSSRISIIIPARNEERNLDPLLASLAALTPRPLETIVVDDHSNDQTADVARRHGARVVQPPPLPRGWRGKTWACRHGASAAEGDLLLFLDADTTLAPDALARFEAGRSLYGCRVLSVAPYHRVQQPYEQLSAIFNVMTHIGSGAFSLFSRVDRPAGLFGPMLLVDRDAYEQVDGHGAVRGEVLEHMSLAPRFRQQSISMCALGGRGVLQTRMYPDGLDSLVEGWSKAFAAGASKTSRTTLMLTVIWLSGALLAFVFSMLSPWLSLLPATIWLTYAAYAVSQAWMWRQIGSFSPWAAVLYPIPLAAFFAIFGRSLLLHKTGKNVSWKGRHFSPSDDEGGA